MVDSDLASSRALSLFSPSSDFVASSTASHVMQVMLLACKICGEMIRLLHLTVLLFLPDVSSRVSGALVDMYSGHISSLNGTSGGCISFSAAQGACYACFGKAGRGVGGLKVHQSAGIQRVLGKALGHGQGSPSWPHAGAASWALG